MKKAFTLLELLVVVMILGLLSTIAVGVFTTQVERAKFSAARATISSMELAIHRYQIDLGEYPPSGSGTIADLANPAGRNYEGCGFLQLALMTSTSGNSSAPSSVKWQGPYLTVKNDLLGNLLGQRVDDPARTDPIVPGGLQILDPWQSPYRYNRSKSLINVDDPDKYENNFGTVLPATHPFVTTEKWYNPNTFQIVSKGPDSVTYATDGSSLTSSTKTDKAGTQPNDVTNFGL